MDHTEAIISAFFKPERAARYMALLSKRDGRTKLRAKLAHLTDLDPRFTHPVAGVNVTPEALERLLKAEGAPSVCYCLSENPELDDRDLSLGDALSRVIGYGMGTILSCVPARLAYFEGEGPRERYVLRRAAIAVR
jgi:hypothetical protein